MGLGGFGVVYAFSGFVSFFEEAFDEYGMGLDFPAGEINLNFF